MKPYRNNVPGMGRSCIGCGKWMNGGEPSIVDEHGYYHEACWQGDPVPYPEDQGLEWMEP